MMKVSFCTRFIELIGNILRTHFSRAVSIILIIQ